MVVGLISIALQGIPNQLQLVKTIGDLILLFACTV